MTARQETIRIYSCDHAGCDATTTAGSAELLNDWAKAGWRTENTGPFVRLHFCGAHAFDATAYRDAPNYRRGA